VLFFPHDSIDQAAGSFAGVGARIANNLFITSFQSLMKVESLSPHTCGGRMGKTILSAKAVGYERDVKSSIDPYPSEYMTTKIGRCDDDPDLVIMRIDKIVGASSRGKRVAPASNDSQECFQATPYLDAATRQEIYHMDLEIELQPDRWASDNCVMYTYFLVSDSGSKKIKFSRQDVKHKKGTQIEPHFRWLKDGPPNRLMHYFGYEKTPQNKFAIENEGSPIFCNGKLSFIASAEIDGLITAISIADNYNNIRWAKDTFPNTIHFPHPPPG